MRTFLLLLFCLWAVPVLAVDATVYCYNGSDTNIWFITWDGAGEINFLSVPPGGSVIENVNESDHITAYDPAFNLIGTHYYFGVGIKPETYNYSARYYVSGGAVFGGFYDSFQPAYEPNYYSWFWYGLVFGVTCAVAGYKFRVAKQMTLATD